MRCIYFAVHYDAEGCVWIGSSRITLRWSRSIRLIYFKKSCRKNEKSTFTVRCNSSRQRSIYGFANSWKKMTSYVCNCHIYLLGWMRVQSSLVCSFTFKCLLLSWLCSEVEQNKLASLKEYLDYVHLLIIWKESIRISSCYSNLAIVLVSLSSFSVVINS